MVGANISASTAVKISFWTFDTENGLSAGGELPDAEYRFEQSQQEQRPNEPGAIARAIKIGCGNEINQCAKEDQDQFRSRFPFNR